MYQQSYELQRTNSVCNRPEDNLLEYVQNNEITKIERLISEYEDLLSYEYGHPFNKTIIQIACKELSSQVNPKTIKCLVDLGADIFYKEKLDGKEALHFATLSANPQILEVIAKEIYQKNPDKINSTVNRNTALLLLVKQGQETENVIDCIKILIKYGIDINEPGTNNQTPILFAAAKGYRKIVNVLLEQNEVDIDSCKYRGKTARELILEKKLNDNELPHQIANNNVSQEKHLFMLLRNGEEEEFERIFDTTENKKDFVNKSDKTSTLLQICAQSCLLKAAKLLLENGADVNKTTETNNKTPLEEAVQRGFYEMTDLLLEIDNINVNATLLDVLKNIFLPSFDEGPKKINYKKCLNLLLRKPNRANINIQDQNLYTPLHYSARYADFDTTLLLLNSGASLANANKFGKLPIEDINAETLEKHFDNCIQSEPKKPDSNNIKITYKYSTLLPSANNKVTNKIPETKVEISEEESKKMLLGEKLQELRSETQVLKYMCTDKELRPLLNHPLITSFLYLKWHRIKYFFYLNLTFYILFCISLISHIFMAYNNPHYVNQGDVFKGIALLFLIILYITYTLLVLREIFQVLISPKKYFFQFDNILELFLIFTIGFLLGQDSPSDSTRKQLAAIAILLAAFELVLIIGQHPSLSIFIMMLRRVSYNFFKFLLWHITLIAAFALSFYTLFSDNSLEGSKVSNKTESKDDDDKNFFVNPGTSLFKTFIMLTGEFEAGDIKFETFPITSYIVFIMFVFMIAIVLLNLLNGLAVSDTQIIKNEAEIYSYIARIEHTQYIENALLGNLVPRNAIKFFTSKITCLPFPSDDWKIKFPRWISRRAFLMPGWLIKPELEIIPNLDGLLIDQRKHFKEQQLYMDNVTVKNTLNLIKRRRAENSTHEECMQCVALKDMIKLQKSYIQELEKYKKSG